MEQRNDLNNVPTTEITPKQREEYIKLIQTYYPDIDPDNVELVYDGTSIRFTAYPPKRVFAKMGGTLIGDPETWNAAKRAEYFDTLPNPIELK